MIISIDIGTTTIAGILFDPVNQVIIRTDSITVDAEVKGLPKGYHEMDPLWIRNAVDGLIEGMLNRSGTPARQVERLALTGQMHGIVLVDEELRPVTNVISWQDQRVKEIHDFYIRHGYISQTGCYLQPGYGGPTLHYLIRKSKVPENAYKALSVPGYIAAGFSGKCAVDETMAASWGIYNLRKNCWHKKLIGNLGIPAELLPEPRASCSALGLVRKGYSRILTGETMVCTEVGDNQAGLAAMEDIQGDEAVINIGTGAQLSVPVREFTYSFAVETRPFPPGKFIQVYAALCGGWSYSYLAGFFRQVVEEIGGKSISHEQVMEQMNAIKDDLETGGLHVDTRFAGVRGEKEGAGSVTGISTENLMLRNLISAFIEGIVEELYDASTCMDMSNIRRLVVTGNAARKNSLYLKALEEKFNLPCRLTETEEEAAMGAVRLVQMNS